MDFPKFVSMLASKSLWFPNAEVLAEVDPFEAMFPAGNYAHRQWKSLADLDAETLARLKVTHYRGGEALEEKFKIMRALLDRDIAQAFLRRKFYFANSWHMSATESAAMWSIYAKDLAGVAITSNADRMRSAFATSKAELLLGKINYLDYDTHKLDLSNVFTPLLCKRESFDYEREVRLVFMSSDTHIYTFRNIEGRIHRCAEPRTDAELERMPVKPGEAIECDLEMLIENVWIAPTAPEWFARAVEHVCRTSGFNFSLGKSKLLTGPAR